MNEKAKEKTNFLEPFKDIPKALKNVKNIKHIVKDPITNSEEADKRKAEILPLLYFGACGLLLFGILAATISKISAVMTIIAIPFFAITVVFGFLLFIVKKAKQKFTDLECPNCKKRIEYDDNVKIEVINKKFTIRENNNTINDSRGVPERATVKVEGTEKINVKVTCTCQDCKTEKTFEHEFRAMQCKKEAIQIPYVQGGATLVRYKSDVETAYNQGLCNLDTSHQTSDENGKPNNNQWLVGNEVKITYFRTPEALVKGYFGNELQI